MFRYYMMNNIFIKIIWVFTYLNGNQTVKKNYLKNVAFTTLEFTLSGTLKKKATQRNDKERTIQQEYSKKLPGVSQKMQMITTNLG